MTSTIVIDRVLAAAAEQAGQEIGRGWATVTAGEFSPDPDYDFSGDGDWQSVREAVRRAAGADADDVWSATDTQPAREWRRLIWGAAADGYRSALESTERPEKEETDMTSTIIIDRDTCTMILAAEELTLGRDKIAIDVIARAVEAALEQAGADDVEVAREYRTTGRRSTAEGLEQLLEGVIVGRADELRSEILDAA